MAGFKKLSFMICRSMSSMIQLSLLWNICIKIIWCWQSWQ